MNKIGIRAHDLGKFSASELAQKISEYRFDGTQLVFKKALINVDLEDIKRSFNPPQLMMLGAYFNPVHPDHEVVRQGIENFKKHLLYASMLNADFVGSETGSLMGSPWGYVKENHTDKPLVDVIKIFKDLSDEAERLDVKIAIEGAYAHVAYSPLRLRQILDEIASPHLKVTIDLYNYLCIDNYKQRMTIFEEALTLFKSDIVIFHLKDFIIKDHKLVQVGLGQGLMDYHTIIKRIKQEQPNAHLIFEGVIGKDIHTSYEFIHNLLMEKE